MHHKLVGRSLLNILEDLSVQESKNHSLVDVLLKPQITANSLAFIPPPRWAAELCRRVQNQFKEVEILHQSRLLQAYVHPSFTTTEGISSTMRAWSPLGQAVVRHVVCKWVLTTFDGLKREEINSLTTVLTSDASLSRVVRDHWNLESMILTEVSADLFSKEKLRSAEGLVRWLASSGTQTIPESFSAECLNAQVGVLFAEQGFDRSADFCVAHVLPYLG